LLDGDDLALEIDLPALLDEVEFFDAQTLLAWALERFGRRLAVATSFQIDGMAIIDMAWRIDPHVRIITVDSGRLPSETHALMDAVREKYQVPIEVFYPNTAELEGFVRREGLNPFLRSVDLPKQCCSIRKVHPLRKVLGGLDAWVSGVRRDQYFTRSDAQPLEVDAANGGLIKVNPLITRTEAEVWHYIREWDVPYNPLYDQGYTSIGCAPCTRAVAPDAPPRAGRWWWEDGGHKECGINYRTDRPRTLLSHSSPVHIKK